MPTTDHAIMNPSPMGFKKPFYMMVVEKGAHLFVVYQ
jgi:hypothetical protein